MTSAAILTDAFDRVRQAVHRAVADMNADELADRIDGTTNSIGWLIWHLTRIQDDHLADAFNRSQVWHDGWIERFGLPFDAADTGYGHTTTEVDAVRVTDASILTAYHDAVHARTVEAVREVSDDDLERIVDTSWDPPVSLRVRLVSVIADDLQHAGQAALIRGIVLRRR